jgi:hypothetical protein
MLQIAPILAASPAADRHRSWRELRGRLGLGKPKPKALTRGPGQDWFDVFQPLAEPGPQERGYQATLVLARQLLDYGVSICDDPEFYFVSQCGWGMTRELAEEDDGDEEEGDDYLGFTIHDLPDLLGVPYGLPGRPPYSQAYRVDIAERLLYGSAQIRDEWFPRWLADTMFADVLENLYLRLIALPKEEAIEFVRRHHSKLPVVNPRGLMYAIGAVLDGKLVAVATAGTPTGRWEHPHSVLELTRIASDGSVKGASSMLAARLIDLLQVSNRDPSFPSLFVTYSLTTEEGTTYRALKDKGLRPTKLVKARTGGGSRQQSEVSLSDVDKIRWEAGAAAAPANWTLLKS